MVQTGHDYHRELQSTVDLSCNLDQQTNVVSGELQAKQEELSVGMELNGGEDDSQGCVSDGQGNTEKPHKAPADVVPLQKH